MTYSCGFEDKKAKKEIECDIPNLFTTDGDKCTAKMDSLGRFVLRMPVQNSTLADFGKNLDYKRTFLEPGETYFLLYDRYGWKMFIGSNCRLQNESLNNTLHYMEFGGGDDNTGLEDYQTICDRNEQKCRDMINKTYAEHPNLSERYKQCVEAAMFNAKILALNEQMVHAKSGVVQNKIMETIMKDYQKPTCGSLTLMRFNTRFVGNLVYKISKGHMNYIPMSYVIEKCQLPTTEKQREYISRRDNAMAYMNNELSKVTSQNQRDSLKIIYDRYKTILEDSTTLPKEYITTYTEKCRDMYYIDRIKEALSHYDVDPVVRETFFAVEMYCDMNNYCKSMSEMLLDNIDSVLTMPAAKAQIMATHNKFYAIEHQSIDGHPSLKSNEIVDGITDGEALLKKITEPYRGRYILIDVWGTWCGPCRAALADSKTEYERFAPYNLVYMYLANRSPEETWKNVIKQDNLLGDNIAHYNLPADKQRSIEKFMNVKHYPSYRLITPEGKLLDVYVHPKELNQFEATLKALMQKSGK